MPVSDRDDALDFEAFATMIDSKPFAAYQSRVIAELERSRITCESAGEFEAVCRGQGAVTALRAVLELPKRILREMHKEIHGKSNKPS